MSIQYLSTNTNVALLGALVYLRKRVPVTLNVLIIKFNFCFQIVLSNQEEKRKRDRKKIEREREREKERMTERQKERLKE